jgi:hypothetical protein
LSRLKTGFVGPHLGGSRQQVLGIAESIGPVGAGSGLYQNDHTASGERVKAIEKPVTVASWDANLVVAEV